ncbi:helix-turn-helix domain-containing protein [Streptomyces lomondensis]|uniref:Transcriptional regulator n=1 Tax=Streptomyces lomondensis TaxID=68229 RepID=A0ABQ2X8L4_9ACTN|nr:helix-turn-helix transcriptional regulator [Streptomyces lomondensis]MCF0077344.1 helix-turn-helix domain-containing protein [Streptomyces lomondensis]GGX04814.1 transcriptional regulator [Streptomyces lomondensis]
MSVQDDVDDVGEFAALLRTLKERTDRSYGSLARRLAMNTSTLHRYCAGDAVPVDFAPVERFAALCGASAEERLELHRRWLLAVAARQRPRTASAAGTAEEGAVAAEAAEEDAADAADGTAVGQETGPSGEPPLPRGPWYRRRRLAVGLAAACALLATLGSLAALPDGRRTPADDRARAAGPSAAGTTEAEAPDRRTASPTPDDSPTAERPSPSATPKEKEKKEPSPAPSSRTTPPTGKAPSGTPLTWSADSQAWNLGCGHDYVIARPPSRVAPPPAPQDAGVWAAAHGAVHGGETIVELSVQGRSDTAVVLHTLRVRVVGRAAPVQGNAYAMNQGCGGSVTPRHFTVNLDKDRPLAHAVPGSDAGTPIPAVRMPYRVSAQDPEVLLVTARTAGCDCRWYLELDWSSQGRRGTVRIDDDGRPFRTSGIEGLPRYMYDTSARQWTPYS